MVRSSLRCKVTTVRAPVKMGRRRVIGGVAMVLAVMLVLLVGWFPAAAQGMGWQATGLTIPVAVLYTPYSGAFFALTSTGSGDLWRSDDGGTTWYQVPLPAPPAGRRVVAVDPTNHMVLYASGAGGLYRSVDDAQTWSLVRPSAERILAIVVSPAASNVVYLATTPPSGSGAITLYRSQNGGSTWQSVGQFGGASPCTPQVHLLSAHPTDPQRAFHNMGCFAGRDAAAGRPLWQSSDHGQTWSIWFPQQVGQMPRMLVGGEGTQPQRFYLVTWLAASPGRSWLHRTDDDGQTWTQLLESNPTEVIGGLAFDPYNPDTVYVGWRTIGLGVKVSQDAGASWSDLGLDDQVINAVALGIDGLNLYAATDQGVWRLSLSGAQAVPPSNSLPEAAPMEDFQPELAPETEVSDEEESW